MKEQQTQETLQKPRGTTEWVPPKTPFLAVDVVIYYPNKVLEDTEIVVIERKYPPLGIALPGGFVDYGEQAVIAAIREAREETGLQVTVQELLGLFDEPTRDPRKHVCSAAYLVTPIFPTQRPKGADDAQKAYTVKLSEAVSTVPWVFDHAHIIATAVASIMKR